ncbi:Peroxidase [Handroanthus impetiginosus]|nr:Peroxidase [Handroanthus impetiginosus]
MWQVFTWRKDGKVSLASEATANLPSASANFTTLLKIFANNGLDLSDLAALSGAHTIGVSHCTLVARRLYNFTGKGDSDPSLNIEYANKLRTICPNLINSSTILEMDPESSLSFDSHY